MPGLTWQTPPQRAFAELAGNYRQTIERGIYAICQSRAPEIEQWMKDNAPWTDRTGNARQALYTEVNWMVGEMIELIMAHGMDYGIYLELRNAGRYAIIAPTLDRFGPLIWADVRRMLS